MLIKIRTSNTTDSWEILTPVSQVTYSGNYFTNSSETYLAQLQEANIRKNTSLINCYGSVVSPLHLETFGGHRLRAPDAVETHDQIAKRELLNGMRYTWIKYFDGVDMVIIIHNTMAYICNDDGKTIHKSVVEAQLTTHGVPAPTPL